MKSLLFLLLFVSNAQAATQIATFGGGCFWGMEESFRAVPGVTKTRVGYTGGTDANPSYEKVSGGSTGHAESLEIYFDPSKVTYEALLTQFFKMHDPTTLNKQGNDAGTQYRSAVFFQNEEQKKTVDKVKAKAEKAWKAKVTTEISPAKTFYPAEEYHQKYLVKHPGGYDNHYVRKLDF